MVEGRRDGGKRKGWSEEERVEEGGRSGVKRGKEVVREGEARGVFVPNDAPPPPLPLPSSLPSSSTSIIKLSHTELDGFYDH